MKKSGYLFIFCAFYMLLSSCSKEEFKTEGEIVGEKIKSLAESENIRLATTYLIQYLGDDIYTWSDEYQVKFTIDGQIIKVGQTYYNLSKLVKYKIDDDEHILLLYFEGFQN